jgi:hypothetical protein
MIYIKADGFVHDICRPDVWTGYDITPLVCSSHSGRTSDCLGEEMRCSKICPVQRCPHQWPCKDREVLFNCQGFTKSHSSLGLNGLQPQGLKEYSDSYLILDYLGPILGSKCLVTQTTGNYLGLGPLEETSEKMFQVTTQTFNLLYYFPYMYIHIFIGLTSLASIYSQTPVLL